MRKAFAQLLGTQRANRLAALSTGTVMEYRVGIVVLLGGSGYALGLTVAGGHFFRAVGVTAADCNDGDDSEQ